MNRLGYLALLLGCSVLVGAAVGPGYAAIGAQDLTTDRTFGTSEPEPGETVRVTATVQLDSEAEVSYLEEFAPELGSAELVSVQVDGENVSTLLQSVEPDGIVAVLDPVGPGEVSFTYDVTVPADAQTGTTYAFDGLFEVGDSEHPVEGDSELTVGAGSPEFEVTADAMDGTVTAGEDATVEYTVENTGSSEGTQTLSFAVDGTEADTEEVSLGRGETTSGSFSYTTTTGDQPEVELGVTSEDDSATVTVTVDSDSGGESADDGTGDDSSDDGSDDSSDGSGPGFGPVVVLGAATVLTAYSLGRMRTED